MHEDRRVYARISYDALDHNLDLMASKIKKNTKIAAVVKANCYGHGAVNISRHIEDRPDIWGFACASAMEAIQLRKAGISKPIMLLGYAFPESYPEMISLDIRACVFNYETAVLLSEQAAQLGKKEKIHIALDTGMSRIGFSDGDNSIDEIVRISKLPNLEIEGLFTHFARADEPSIEPAEVQLARYLSFSEKLERAGVDVTYHHASNSAGIMRFGKANLDLVRAGITMYGLLPSEEIADETAGIRPLMELVSHVSHVKVLPKGCAVSYGGTYVTTDSTKVATIPVGYADGYPRTLSNKGTVLIKGQRVPILGRVCMDQLMVDVTSIEEITVGEEVVLLGSQGNETISAEEIGRLSGRFNYELVSCITQRVPRHYVQNGTLVEHVDYLT